MGKLHLLLIGMGVFGLSGCQEGPPLASDQQAAPRTVGQQECGQASYYGIGNGLTGRRTANGIRMVPSENDKAACAYHLLDHWITLECGGKSFDVLCVDRGGFRADEGGKAYSRVIDLYAGTFSRCFGGTSQGVGRLCYRLGKKSQQVGQYCGVGFEQDTLHFKYEEDNSGVRVSVDKRCPGTQVALVFIDVQNQSGKIKVVSESKEWKFTLRSEENRKSVVIPYDELRQMGAEKFSNMRFIVSNSKEVFFSTGPKLPSPPVPRALRETGTSKDSFAKAFEGTGFIDTFTYDGLDLKTIYKDFKIYEIDWNNPGTYRNFILEGDFLNP